MRPPRPIEGERYRYIGGLRSHHGLIGVASCPLPLGTGWLLTLSNVKEWGARGLETSLSVFSDEIELVVPPPPTRPVSTQSPPPPPTSTFNFPSPMKVQDAANILRGISAPAPPDDAFMGLEKDLVQECSAWLEGNGFEVAVVGQHQAQGSGTTVGYPDLSLRHPVWPRGIWVVVELKTATGTLSPEQEALWRRGGSHVAYSVGEVERIATTAHRLFRAVVDMAEALGGPPRR